MKKHLFNIFLAVLAVCNIGLLLSSCQDDLDVTPDGRMPIDVVFSTPENTKDYFASAWSHIPQKMFMYYFFDNFLIDMADEGWSTAEYQPLLISDIYAGNCNTTKHRFEWDDTSQGKWDGGYWTRYWSMIRILNNCLKHFPDAAFESESERELCTAEARVLRAFYYLQLVKFYGDLPIITDVLSVNSSYAGMERSAAWEVLQHIVAECEAALESSNLPWSITAVQQKNRMTKGIACAIISQASLFAASPLFCKDQNLWQYAYDKNKKAFDLLIANGYELYTHLVDNKSYHNCYQEYFASRSYAGSKADDKETIWGSPLNWGVNHSTINGVPIFAVETHQAGCIPTQELVDAYDMLATGEPIYDLANPYVDEKHSDININTRSGYNPEKPYEGRDPRFYASVIYNGSKLNTGVLNKTVEIWNNENTWDGKECSFPGGSGNAKIDIKSQRYTRTGYYNNKYHTYKVTPGQMKDEGNWKYYRLGEIYLNLAECAVETNKISEAMNLVNDIRHRAGFDPSVDKVTSDKDYARLIVRHERQVELAFEEHRYFDCRRWGTVNEDIKEERYNTGMWIHKNGTKYVYVRFPLGKDQGNGLSKYCSAAKYRLVPIPLTESSTLGALTGFGADYWQNPGWE